METKGLIVDVYRDANMNCDCTAGGITSRFTALLLLCEEGPFTGNEENSLVMKTKHVGGEEYKYAVPVKPGPSGCVGPMFGGNFVYSSDSRFRKMSKYPLPIHDRYEVQILDE